VLPVGQWGTTLSVTRTRTGTTRGFLDEDDADADEIDANATGFSQNLRTTDVFFDTHVTSELPGNVLATYGLNELYGRAAQDSRTFAYFVPLDGAAVGPSTAGTPAGSAALADRRSFFGAYAQAKWPMLPTVSLLGGLRWNHIHESRETGDPQEPEDASLLTQAESRWSGTLGASWKVWADSTGDFDDVTLHAGWGSTFQPPQIDFGPDTEGEPMLKPETMRHVEFGIKVDGYDGRLDLDVTAFVADFANQATATVVNGVPALAAAGTQRFKGVEVEASFRVGLDLSLTAHASYNDARYRDDATLIDGAPVQLAGNGIPMSPRTLAGAGVVYAPTRGWRGSVIANYVGSRYADALNTQRLAAYTTADASLGYAFDRFTLSASATNIGNRRDPVLPSELGEGQLYRLPGRHFTIGLAYALR
jgi:outer membrane receptor for ferrienterochelin and colicin